MTGLSEGESGSRHKTSLKLRQGNLRNWWHVFTIARGNNHPALESAEAPPWAFAKASYTTRGRSAV